MIQNNKTILSQSEYYNTNRNVLKNISCPNCGIKGLLFTGFFYINCRACDNLYLTSEEFFNTISLEAN